MKSSLPFRQITFILSCFFVVFIISYNNHERRLIQEAIEQHASVISTSLWNFDKKSQVDYLAFAAEHNNYGVISVIDHKGEVFLTASNSLSKRFERILLSLKLIPAIQLSAPVIYENQRIGTVDVIWYRKTIYIYFYVLVVLFLLLNVIYFYNRLLKSKISLEDRVEERTAELKISEQKFKLLFESAGDAIFIMKENIFIDCNDKTLELFNCSREKIVGQSPYRFSPKVQPNGRNSKKVVLEKLNLALGGVPQHFEWQHSKYDGTLFDAEVSLNVFEVAEEKYLQAIVRDITERKMAEYALIKSEEKYSTLVERSNDIIFIFQDDVIKFANMKMATFSGYTLDELIGANAIDFITEPFRELVHNRSIRRMAGEDVPSIYEIEVITKDGRNMPVEINSTAIEYEGRPAVMVFMRDISERKKAEESLRQKEEQQALILRSLPMAFYVAQPFGNYGGIWVSEQIESLTGYSPSQFVADINIWSDRIHSDDKEYVLEEFEKITETGFVSVEYRWQTADGSYRWFNDEGVLILDDKGAAKEVVGTWLDITERKNEQEMLYITQHTVDHNSLPILWVQSFDKIIYVNEAACKLLSYSIEEILNQHVGFIHPEGSTEYWDKIFPLLKEKKKLELEVALRKKDGTNFPAIVTPTYLEYADREITVINIHDISDRKRLETELRQAQKMEAIGTLAGGIAHDFNNILSGIFGYTEMARMDIDEPEKLEDDLDGVTKGAQRAKELVKQVLTFSRRTELQKNPLQLSLIVKEALKLIRPSVPTSIEIKQNIRSNALTVADPSQMHQVIMNLCTNAYQAMRETGGCLTISLTEEEVDAVLASRYPEAQVGSYLMLTISDTGHGMGRDTIDKIFEPYFTTKEVGEGTGLGLAVVHGIIIQSGGFIDVSSQIGKGTSFNVFLPIFIRKDVDTPTSEDKSAPVQMGTESIMFVDDEENIRLVAVNILGRFGYNVTVFNNGYEAWQEYKGNAGQFDLIVTDMAMPQMNGVELASNILHITPDRPIIICSGYSDLIDRETALAMGITEYLTKPVAMSDLARIIREVLKEKTG